MNTVTIAPTDERPVLPGGLGVLVSEALAVLKGESKAALTNEHVHAVFCQAWACAHAAAEAASRARAQRKSAQRERSTEQTRRRIALRSSTYCWFICAMTCVRRRACSRQQKKQQG